MKIGDKYTGSTQDYGKKPEIQGVHLLDLKRFNDCGGSFNEIVRLIDGKVGDFEIKQVNYSEVLPGAVKAGHYHLEQDDLWFVPADSRLLVGLKDLREDSPSYEVVSRVVLGGGKAQLLFIPRGVLHGLANLWGEPARLIYFVNQNFNPDAADEHRLPPEEFGEGFWEIQKG
ncbi:MAG: dTDP-4-dehydrorhamnose 3,5-epimerase family protein [Patescibacteria group bacterium]|nr:dTDP-4-dehydrorhamnose 3,5-epimerase family protein [Patescibacteria group bacterium]